MFIPGLILPESTEPEHTEAAPSAQKSAGFAQVALLLETKQLQQQVFTYSIPPQFQGEVTLGTPVSVPFGRIPNVTGLVVALTEAGGEGFRIKPISDVLSDTPLFDEAYLEFLQWVGQLYATPLSQVISCALPASLLQKSSRVVVWTEQSVSPLAMLKFSPSQQKVLTCLQQTQRPWPLKSLAKQAGLSLKELQKQISPLQKLGLVETPLQTKGAVARKTETWVKPVGSELPASLTARQQAIFEAIQKYPEGLSMKQAIAELGTTAPTLKKLVDEGCLTFFETTRYRDPLQAYSEKGHQTDLVLTNNQHQVVQQILAATPGTPTLLYGVTGAGKTEVYLTLTDEALAQGKTVLVLVPEIALTSHIAKRFIHRYGRETIALWHSNLSAGEKADTWHRIRQGELRVVIGARSAIFTPIQELGLLIIDEEHDGSLKQDSPAPRYHAKVLAEELAQRHQARFVLGSATPDITSFYRAQEENRLVSLTQRYGGRPLAQVEIVDMKQERGHGNTGILSRSLQSALQETLEAKQQAILLINRRGFHTIVSCSECQWVAMCPHCSVSLTVHRARRLARCHYCGFEDDIAQFCPQCASMDLAQTGTGSQRVEEEVFKLFPNASIIRLDGDIAQKKYAPRELLEAFGRGEADILVGTQMVAKGLDVANVTTVGVIQADASFYFPDYKASERGFQLLTQVAGRAGRGEKPGRAIFQTMDPHHPVLQFAREQNYPDFYAHELQSRRELIFPPFCQLFRFIVSHPNEQVGLQFIQALTAHLNQAITQANQSDALKLLGPAPCVIGKIQDRYRFHLLAKNMAGIEGQQLITRFYQQIAPLEDLHCILDTDPQALL